MADKSNNFRKLVKDSTGSSMPVGQTFMAQDETGSPKTSPLSVSSSVITLTVPARAVEFICVASAACRISALNNNPASAPYFVLPAGIPMTFPVSNQDALYVVRDSSDLTLNFYFVIV